MPEPVAQGIEAAVVVARAQLVVGVEVGDVGKLGVLQAAHHAMVARRLDRTEQLAQAQQAVVVERLIVEDQHGRNGRWPHSAPAPSAAPKCAARSTPETSPTNSGCS